MGTGTSSSEWLTVPLAVLGIGMLSDGSGDSRMVSRREIIRLPLDTTRTGRAVDTEVGTMAELEERCFEDVSVVTGMVYAKMTKVEEMS